MLASVANFCLPARVSSPAGRCSPVSSPAGRCGLSTTTFSPRTRDCSLLTRSTPRARPQQPSGAISIWSFLASTGASRAEGAGTEERRPNLDSAGTLLSFGGIDGGVVDNRRPLLVHAAYRKHRSDFLGRDRHERNEEAQVT